eukprot:Hpha_TRINITY_DN15707_c1_g13::TRINITY_DN15707_c1_g13_i1::g.39410::m.39410
MATGLLLYLRKGEETRAAELGLDATVGDLQAQAMIVWEMEEEPHLVYAGEDLADKRAPLSDVGLSQEAVVEVGEGYVAQWDPDRIQAAFMLEGRDTIVFKDKDEEGRRAGWRWAAAVPNPTGRLAFAVHLSSGWTTAKPHPKHITVGVMAREEFDKLDTTYGDGKGGMSCFMMHSMDLRNIRNSGRIGDLRKELNLLFGAGGEVEDFRLEVQVHACSELRVMCYNQGQFLGGLTGTLPTNEDRVGVVGMYGSEGTKIRIRALYAACETIGEVKVADKDDADTQKGNKRSRRKGR